MRWVRERSIAGLIGVTAASLMATRPSLGAIKQSAKLVYVRGAGAESCPDEAAVRASVAVRLGYDPFALKPNEEPKRTVVAAVIHDGLGFHARIEVRDATAAVKGTRKLDSKASECGELASAITFAITLAIDPLSGGAIDEGPLPLPPVDEKTNDAGKTGTDAIGNGGVDVSPTAKSKSSSGPGDNDSTPSLSAPPPTRFDEDVPPASEQREQADVAKLLTSAGVVSSLGYEPGIGVGATIGAALRWKRFSIGVEGRADLPGEKTLGSGGGVRSSVILATLLPCAHRGVALACVLGSFGSLRSTGLGADGQTDASLFAAAGARLGAEVPFSESVRGRFVLDVAATISGARLRYGAPSTEVWESPLLTGALGAAIIGVF